MTKRQPPFGDTGKSKNLEIRLVGQVISVDDMEAILGRVAERVGLVFSHITTLGAKTYPGNRHWHLKQDLKAKGCLDVTYWPDGPWMWVTIRNYEPDWVHELGGQLVPLVEQELN